MTHISLVFGGVVDDIAIKVHERKKTKVPLKAEMRGNTVLLICILALSDTNKIITTTGGGY